MRRSVLALVLALLPAAAPPAQESHRHGVPEHLGTVSFDASCAPDVVPDVDRAVALLHSFAYDEAGAAFAAVATRDPRCAIARWGRAMSLYHPLWEAPSAEALAEGAAHLREAVALDTGSPRDRALIAALSTYYADAEARPPAERAQRYADAMAAVARDFPDDDEVATFHALSLLAIASPADRTHAKQQRAADILEPIWQRQPDHPGVPHYLIHAYDSAALAQRGVPAARAYAKIAPSAPHALHMPSHIFTRLGLWDDSIAANIASREAAKSQGDLGEQVHAMDYLTYAYLQRGRIADAAAVVANLRTLSGVAGDKFKTGYAGNAMPVRLAIESRDWPAAAKLTPIQGSSPQVAALVWWARALGKLRASKPANADEDIRELQSARDALLADGNAYWAAQTDALLKSAEAWRHAAAGDHDAAIAALTAAADEEDALEKLPVTPGPIVPAREQLGEMLLLAGRPREALQAFDAALALAPGRAGALRGKAEAQRAIAPGVPAAGPIIDVHRHGTWPGSEAAPYRAQMLEEMDANGVVLAVLSITEPRGVEEWVDAAPGRFLAGPMLPCNRNLSEPRHYCFPDQEGWADLAWLREEAERGRITVLHEVNPSYAGLRIGNPRVAPYLALAAELDLPVGVHTQRGPRIGSPNSTRSRPGCCPEFDPEMGNPALLRPVLEQHPGLRVWLQHVGAGRGAFLPFWDETLALLRDYPNVYLDLSITNGAMPQAQYEDSLKRLIDAGYGDRIMFGSDNLPLAPILARMRQVTWLDDAQRRAILYDNAARFFRLDEATVARHRGQR